MEEFVNLTKKNDIIIVMGAGDIYKIEDDLLKIEDELLKNEKELIKND